MAATSASAASSLSQEQEYKMLLFMPVTTPPPGQHAVIDQGPVKLEVALIFIILTGVLGSISVAIALFTKLHLMKKPSWTDALLALGWALSMAYLVNGVFVILAGGGKHMWDLRIYEFENFLYSIYVEEIIFGVTNIFLKVAILLQYRELFSTKQRNFTWWNIHILITIIVLFYIIISFFQIFSCIPRSAFWDILNQSATCMSKNAILLSASIFNALSDVLILIIPHRVIWSLQLPLKRKLAISAVFLIGLGACVSSTVRAYYAFGLLWNPDVAYQLTTLGYWTVAEIFCGLLCASLPKMPRFFQFLGTYKGTMSFKLSMQSLLRSRRTHSVSNSSNTEVNTKPHESHIITNKSFGSNKGGYIDLGEYELGTTAKVYSHGM